jgi:hypothetical protein
MDAVSYAPPRRWSDVPGVPVCRTTALLRLVGACPVHLVGPRLPYHHDLLAEGAERSQVPADPLESLLQNTRDPPWRAFSRPPARWVSRPNHVPPSIGPVARGGPERGPESGWVAPAGPSPQRPWRHRSASPQRPRRHRTSHTAPRDGPVAHGSHQDFMSTWFPTSNVLLHASGHGNSLSEHRGGRLMPHDGMTKAVQTCDGSTRMLPA